MLGYQLLQYKLYAQYLLLHLLLDLTPSLYTSICANKLNFTGIDFIYVHIRWDLVHHIHRCRCINKQK